jgi:hypothetical protein
LFQLSKPALLGVSYVKHRLITMPAMLVVSIYSECHSAGLYV